MYRDGLRVMEVALVQKDKEFVFPEVRLTVIIIIIIIYLVFIFIDLFIIIISDLLAYAHPC